MHRDKARIWLAGIRILNGAAALLAPKFLARRVRAAPNPEPSPAAIYAFRLFGVRTVKIGADLLSGDAAVREHAARDALSIHASDTMTAAMLLLRGLVTKRAGIMLTAISGLNTFLAFRARPPE
jgi:hypothetical protein